jgi:hypothetical protein
MKNQNNNAPRRLPHLGRLSVAILEEYVKKVIGDEAIKEIKTPIQQKELSDSLAKALQAAEKRFVSEYQDIELTRGLIDLPIEDLPSLRQAIWGYANNPTDPTFRDLLHKQLDQDYPTISADSKSEAVEFYLRILRQELISISTEMREKLSVSALYDIDEKINQMVRNIYEFINLWQQEHQKPIMHGSVPPLPQLVIGRENDIEELKKKLGIKGGRERATAILTAVRGWPGVGKTTIASVLAHDPDIVQVYPDGVLWVSLGQQPNILSEIATWGRQLGTDELRKAQSIPEAQAQLTMLLRDKRMLLLIDDVWKTEHATAFNVGGQGCATLITTRLNDIARDLAPNPESVYFLPVLTIENSMRLMEILAPSVVQKYRDDVLLLVRDLEGLPLALQVAGRLLQTEFSTGFSVNDLISQLRESAKLLEEKSPPDRADIVNETTPKIAALLQKSTDILDLATRDNYAYLGAFAPKPATFGLDAMAFVWQVKDPKPIVRQLVNHGLLEYVIDLDRFQMHALLVMHAKSLLTDV